MSRTLGNTIGATKGLREGCAEIVHTYPFSYNTTGITSGVRVDVINATSDAPVYIEASVQILTSFNDSLGNDILIGTSASGDDYLVVDGSGAAGYYPASNVMGKFQIATATPLFITFNATGSDATTGSAVLIVREFTQNILPVA